MERISNVEALKSYLLGLGDAESSFALVVLRGVFDSHALVAVRQAERLCDHVVVLALDASIEKGERFLAQAGVNVLYSPHKEPFLARVELDVKGVDATLILQTALAVMPMMVAISPTDIVLHTALERLSQTFPDVLNIYAEETPVHLLGGQQKKARTVLESAKVLLQKGEGDFNVIRHTVQNRARLEGLSLVSLQVLNEDLRPMVSGERLPHGLVAADFDGVKDVLRF